VSATIYIEGGASGPESREQDIRCREGFRKLLEKSGFTGRLPRLFACGGRNAAWDAFKTAQATKAPQDYVALWIDSEDPMASIEETWAHLQKRDGWEKPAEARDDQVLMMTTCMETWIIADRAALRAHYGNNLQVSALPAIVDLEKRHRHLIHDRLEHATRNCSNAYRKGKRSFVILAKLTPDTLKAHLPSFDRILRILREKL
jgi:hypothetical protein